MTNFVVNLTAKHLKDRRESLVDHGCPQGLMAVILVAVSMYPLEALSLFSQITQLECAAHAFESGVLVKPSIFNHEYNRLFTENKSIDKFSHWDKFYKECSVSQSGKTPKCHKSTAVDLSLVEIEHGDLNFSSSPLKE
jgi:hypothetical protein